MNPNDLITPTSVKEAQTMLDQIGQQGAQLQSQYQQLQLQAAWLQGWIANQAQKTQPAKAPTAKKQK